LSERTFGTSRGRLLGGLNLSRTRNFKVAVPADSTFAANYCSEHFGRSPFLSRHILASVHIALFLATTQPADVSGQGSELGLTVVCGLPEL
jgi:hypothetical protein